jgi:hypothetical protein
VAASAPETHDRALPTTANVHFFVVPSGVTIERLREIDPDRNWTDMRRAKERWVVAAYARLKRRGWPVTLGSDVPDEGSVVYHKEDHSAVLARAPRAGHPVLIACRADFRSADEADFEVLQNGHYADDRRCFFIPLWPQPGLVPRDADRGARVENIAFKGYVGNLLPELREEPFSRFLEDNGMRMTLDTIVDKDVSQPVAAAWHDYRNVDVVLAMRPAGDREHTHKPASKLYNSWLAGVPAVLSPDYAFRELRRGPLDDIEVQSVDEARAALLKLRRDPALYQAMVDNGRVRGRDFTADAIADRWQTLLYETLPPLVAARPRWQGGRFGRAVIGVGRKLRRTLSGGARR